MPTFKNGSKVKKEKKELMYFSSIEFNLV